MKILLAIPSKDRIETLGKYTWPWLKLLPYDFKVFVEPQDEGDYQAVFGYDHIIDIQKNNEGLGWAKFCIKNYAISNNYDLVFKLDDDIRGFTDYRTKLTPEQTAEKVIYIINKAVKVFEKYQGVQAISFPYAFELYERKEWEKAKRIQTAFIVRTTAMYADPRVNVFEDFATGLSIIAKGGMILKYGLSGIDCGVKVGGGTGGHQSYDRFEQAKKEIEYLREIYPPLNFKKVDKPWVIEPDMRSVK